MGALGAAQEKSADVSINELTGSTTFTNVCWHPDFRTTGTTLTDFQLVNNLLLSF